MSLVISYDSLIKKTGTAVKKRYNMALRSKTYKNIEKLYYSAYHETLS